jgi:putative ABC transport system substrate-binding protein
MMDRRAFIATIAGSLLTAPLAAEAQGPGRIWRIGLLFTGAPPPESSRGVEALRGGLRDLGYIEGRNIAFEYRWAQEGHNDQLPDLAADLVRRGVDVIVAQTTAHTQAARRATSMIPIVMGAVTDPVGSGLVSTLARPGGNVTGSSLLAPAMARKLLEFLKETFPRASRVAALVTHDDPGTVLARKEVEEAAKLIRVQLHVVEVREAKDLDRAFQAAKVARVHAVIAVPSPLFGAHHAELAQLALKHRLPAVSMETGFADAGGLMSYGTSVPDSFRRAAAYIDRILKGAKPADLPIAQPTKFELVINLKTAKALGLTIPQSLLQRADQVIE